MLQFQKATAIQINQCATMKSDSLKACRCDSDILFDALQNLSRVMEEFSIVNFIRFKERDSSFFFQSIPYNSVDLTEVFGAFRSIYAVFARHCSVFDADASLAFRCDAAATSVLLEAINIMVLLLLHYFKFIND